MFCTVDMRAYPSRSCAASVVVEKLIYTFGGRKKYSSTPGGGMEVFVFNTVNFKSLALQKSQTCSMFTDEPLNRYGHSAVLCGNKIYIWGGRRYECITKESVMEDCSVYCFDVAAKRWSQMATSGEPPSCRFDHRACVADCHMYIFGGKTCDNFDNKVSCNANIVPVLDLEMMEWKHITTKGDLPHYIYKHTLVVNGSLVYCLGVAGICSSSAVFCLDTETRKWDMVSTTNNIVHQPISNMISYMCAFGHKNNIYLLKKNSKDSEEVSLRYSIYQRTWNTLNVFGQLHSCKYCFSLAPVEDKVFMFGEEIAFPLVEDGRVLTIRRDKKELQAIDCHYGSLSVLHMAISLRTLCLLVITKHKLNPLTLPASLQHELALMQPYSVVTEKLIPSFMKRGDRYL